MILTITQAQLNSAGLYRRYARLAPWNSKTRREWLKLAESAERVAEHFKEKP